jgi:solute:Na+ symporter, SSS family
MLIGYMGLILYMGYHFSKKNTSTEEYFVGGRSFPGWVIGLSLVGTSISSITFLAFPGDAYKTAWLRFLPNLMMPFAVLIAAYLFLPFFRRGKLTSAYEYLEHRFGPGVRLYGSIAFIITQLIRLSLILYLISLLLHELTGVSTTWSILIAGGFVAIYTIMGGIDAVIWTDVMQTLVLLFGGIVTLLFIVTHLPGGMGQIFSVAIADSKLGFADLIDGRMQASPIGFSLQSKTVSMMLIIGLLNFLTEYSGNQNIVQRYVAAKSTREARKGMLVGVVTSIPIWTFYMFLGTALYVFFKVFPTIESMEILEGTRKAEQILPYFIINYLPPGITGFVIAAAMAAAMSSLDSSINAVSTVSIIDIYKRHIKKDRPDRHYLVVAWIIAAVTGGFMIFGAILLANTDAKTFQDTSTMLASVAGGGLLGMFCLGFFTTKGDSRAVFYGIVTTIVFSIWTVLAKKGILPNWLSVPFDLYYTGIVGNFIMFVVGYVASLIIPGKKRDLTNYTIWTQDGTPLD